MQRVHLPEDHLALGEPYPRLRRQRRSPAHRLLGAHPHPRDSLRPRWCSWVCSASPRRRGVRRPGRRRLPVQPDPHRGVRGRRPGRGRAQPRCTTTSICRTWPTSPTTGRNSAGCRVSSGGRLIAAIGMTEASAGSGCQPEHSAPAAVDRRSLPGQRRRRRSSPSGQNAGLSHRARSDLTMRPSRSHSRARARSGQVPNVRRSLGQVRGALGARRGTVLRVRTTGEGGGTLTSRWQCGGARIRRRRLARTGRCGGPSTASAGAPPSVGRSGPRRDARFALTPTSPPGCVGDRATFVDPLREVRREPFRPKLTPADAPDQRPGFMRDQDGVPLLDGLPATLRRVCGCIARISDRPVGRRCPRPCRMYGGASGIMRAGSAGRDLRLESTGPPMKRGSLAARIARIRNADRRRHPADRRGAGRTRDRPIIDGEVRPEQPTPISTTR